MRNYKKWKPVMDSAFPYKSDEFKQVMSEYAEHHSLIDNTIVDYTFNNTNLLPFSLRVLSQIEIDRFIEKNNFIISDVSLETITISLKISWNDWDDLQHITNLGYNYVQQCENILRTKLVELLNKLLKGATTFSVYKLIDSISIVNLNGSDQNIGFINGSSSVTTRYDNEDLSGFFKSDCEMVLKSNFKITGGRKDKLKRILDVS
jgi:hypothetical protein